jgi:carbamoyl-phosphate synthase large subunit
LIINTPSGQKSQSDMRSIRAEAILHNVPCITTLQAALAAVNGIEAIIAKQMTVRSLQDYYSGSKGAGPKGTGNKVLLK